MSEWSRSTKKIGGICCIRHRDDGDDISLAGRHGIIYPSSDEEYTVLVGSTRSRNVRGMLGPITASKGDEISLRVKESGISGWVRALRVPRNRPRQIFWMEKLHGHHS